jgi:hypothetical protein
LSSSRFWWTLELLGCGSLLPSSSHGVADLCGLSATLRPEERTTDGTPFLYSLLVSLWGGLDN